MDAVELPLPANVVVSKLLVAEGFTRIKTEGSETRGVSILGNHSLASCSSSKGDITYPVHPSEQKSVSKTEKKTDVQNDKKILLPNFNSEDSNRQCLYRETDNSFVMLPEYSGKQLRRKAVKVPRSSSPCAKRPKTDQVGDSTILVGHDDNIVMCGKMGLNTAKCNSAEKSRVVKQKHGQVSKRGDKRNFRAVVKTKFDPLSSGSAIGANNILGIYGLKSDVHDVTKHMDELSLKDLIDGTYRSPNPIQDSGKSISNKESFILSVRKACSILPLYCANHSGAASEVDGSSERKPATCRLSAGPCIPIKKECDNKDNFMTEILSSSKEIISKLGPVENLRGTPLYQPKDIQGRLALPPVNDLGSLISHTPVPALPYLQRLPDLHSGTQTPQSASLPPFSWSLYPTGPCKANLDPGKLSTSRNICQQRWIKIGSNTSSFGSIHSRFSDQDFRYDHNSVSVGELKFNGLLVKSASLPVSSCNVVCPLASQVPNKTILKNEPVALSSDCPSEPSFPEGHLESRYECYLKNGSKEHMPFLSPDTQDNMKRPGKEEMCMDLSQLEIENSKAITDWHTDSNCYLTSKPYVVGCDQHLQHLPLAEISKHVGHSPRLLVAAQTLCEIASYSSNDRGKRRQDNLKVRWPRKSSQKVMKAPKPRTSTGKAVEGYAVSTKLSDPIRSMGNVSSPKPKILMTDKKKNLIHIDHGHKGSVKWPANKLIGSRYPTKLGGDHVGHTKQLSAAESAKLLGMLPLLKREDRLCSSSQQKLRKASVPAGSQAKDLVMRSKRE